MPLDPDVVYDTVSGGSISVYKFLIKPLIDTSPASEMSSARLTAFHASGVIGAESVTPRGTVSIIREKREAQRRPKVWRVVILSSVMLRSEL